MDWFLYNNGLRHERVKYILVYFHIATMLGTFNNLVTKNVHEIIHGVLPYDTQVY